MKYVFDHDYHIHSQLSSCSRDPEQTTARILQYAIDNKLRRLVLTDHYWDDAVPGASGWYQKQPYAHIAQALPLPTADGVDYLFGCESDIDQYLTLGIPASRFDDFDFMVIPTTHLHMTGFTISEADAASRERRAALWVSRLEGLLAMDLPFYKVGIAHLACPLINKASREDYLATLDLISDADMERLFAKAAALGAGIELNRADMAFSDAEADRVLRMFRIARYQGCRFYCGSDAHHPAGLDSSADIFRRAIDLLGLQESDKFHIQA